MFLKVHFQLLTIFVSTKSVTDRAVTLKKKKKTSQMTAHKGDRLFLLLPLGRNSSTNYCCYAMQRLGREQSHDDTIVWYFLIRMHCLKRMRMA